MKKNKKSETGELILALKRVIECAKKYDGCGYYEAVFHTCEIDHIKELITKYDETETTNTILTCEAGHKNKIPK